MCFVLAPVGLQSMKSGPGFLINPGEAETNTLYFYPSKDLLSLNKYCHAGKETCPTLKCWER